MKRAAVATIPRETTRPCPACHGKGTVTVLDGRHFRRLRELSKVTLTEMARIFGAKVSVGYLSQMERGVRPFGEKYAALYVRLLDRRSRSGQDW